MYELSDLIAVKKSSDRINKVLCDRIYEPTNQIYQKIIHNPTYQTVNWIMITSMYIEIYYVDKNKRVKSYTRKLVKEPSLPNENSKE